MNIFNEVLGYLGMTFVLISFLMKDIKWLRGLNIVGGTLSCIYGILTKTYPTAVLNLLLVIINVVFLVKAHINTKKNNS